MNFLYHFYRYLIRMFEVVTIIAIIYTVFDAMLLDSLFIVASVLITAFLIYLQRREAVKHQIAD